MAYSDFPMPADYPDFPHHTQVAAYFDAYVDHFGLRERITFQTGGRARRAAATAAGACTLDSGRGARLPRAAGRQRPPLGPALAGAGVPEGAERFEGVQMHSHHYLGDDPALFAGKRVVVLGMGNSAMDIAVEATQTAERVFLAARRGAWIVPKYVFGRPLDQFVTAPRIPLAVRQRFMQTTLRAAVGDMERYGLPKPDHRPLEAHPTISDTILTRLTHGDITPKPNIARLTERTRGLRRRQRGARRRRRLRHRLQGQLPVLRPGAGRPRPTTTCRSSGASSTPTCPACTSSRCCSRSARRCRSPRRSRSGSATT